MIKGKLPIIIDSRNLNFYPREKTNILYDDLINFISDDNYIKNKDYIEHLWFSKEIKFNNSIEGYNDDVELINSVIQNKKVNISASQKQRIINLFNGYKYILKNHPINEANLRGLYDILSKNLLEQNDIDNMGPLYRRNDVYIFYSSDITKSPDMGLKPEEISTHMDMLFEFINNTQYENMVDAYIISQIIHFYFVYIHPYYDINGRTSRTLSMWYLLNNNSNPFIIFNRAIPYDKRLYYTLIRETKSHHNLTFFIEYMLKNVKKELEKEYMIDMIEQTKNVSLTLTDRQTLQYLLTMNGVLTVSDFIKFYNRSNNRMKNIDIYSIMIEPLLEKGVIDIKRQTKGYFNSSNRNFIFDISSIDYDKEKIKYLNIENNKHRS